MTRRNLPPFKSLLAFEAFARMGRMTQAANELNVTHGAVSRQIKSLELFLGTSLLSGPKHHLVLTEGGQRLATSLTSAFDLIGASLPGAESCQQLLISCPGTFAMKWLIPRLPNFLDSRPGTDVRIVGERTTADFGLTGVHAAIRLESGRSDAGTLSQAFLKHCYGPVLSPKLWASVEESLPELLLLPRLYSETFAAGWTKWASDKGILLPTARRELAFERNFYLIEAVTAGLGAAVTAWAFVQSEIADGKLVAPWGFQPLSARFTYVRPGRVENALAREFGRWLLAQGRHDSPHPVA
ncbi:LysR substrate-binding domain-containing protein [Rhizobium sullae]|uniref:LysR substrate-binding domain-containing protein n=1 Tax=Rhizobium sullae TaxID=50338 RepID=UPI0015C6437B|nr:LysR substrate-binding domain-containing protein [Rhizobium sullae]